MEPGGLSTQVVRPSLSTGHLWERYDLCSAVNQAVNGEWSGAQHRDLAQAKAAALLKRGLPALDVSVAELSVDGGAKFAWVVLVRDHIARWVLRPIGRPESLPRLGVMIRSEDGGRR